MIEPGETKNPYRPLADRMRPRNVAEFVGQTHIMAPGKPLRRAIEDDRLHSMVFWGPPGTGKTTLARLITGASGARFLSLSAVLSGVKDIRAAIDEARRTRAHERRASSMAARMSFTPESTAERLK